jgi:DNA-binding NtrC family response regulator
VLILGETGTGKELVARALHTHGARRSKPFVALNCAAFPENLLESELFGHEKGAFTGAEKLRKGKLEYAEGGTIFLDEIGDMPPSLQGKLLRVLEDQEVCRIGGNQTIKVNVRVLSATHRELEAAIQEGRFRRDLYYRLNRVTVRLPPLRERLEDLPELATHFLARAVEGTGRAAPTLADGALDKLRTHRWPGNVRELQNVLCRAVGMCRGPQVLPSQLDLPLEGPTAPVPPELDFGENEAAAGMRKAIVWAWETNQAKLWPLLRDLLERELLKFALVKLDGNQTQIAKRLHLARVTVIKRIKALGLK